MLDARRLAYFLRIAELGSISRAAAQLGVAQPALSHHIRLLEAELGVPLLVRHARGVTATEAGDALAEHARGIMRRIEAAEEDLRNTAGRLVGAVTVGIASSLAESLAPPLLRTVTARYPEVVVRIVEATSTVLAEAVRSERIGVAVNLQGVAESRAEPLFDEDLYLVAGRDLPLGHEITLRQALALPLILPSRPHSMRSLIDRMAADHQQITNIATEVDGFQSLKAVIEAGLGYSILSWTAVERQVKAGLVTAAPIVSPTLTRTMVLDMSPGSRGQRSALAIRQVIIEVVASLFDDGIWRGVLRLPGCGQS